MPMEMPAAPQKQTTAQVTGISNARRAISSTAMFIGLLFAAFAGAIAMYTHGQTGSGKRVQQIWKPAFPQPTGATEVADPEQLEPQGPPVRYANPFDQSEVFEFPHGTTRAAARDAVAEILLQRAAEREKLVRH
jgi:hypothetical protein